MNSRETFFDLIVKKLILNKKDCKKNKHAVNRRLVLQRFFKCKASKTRTYTLDQVCPVKACKQCGAEKFEPSTMKEDDTSILSKDKSNLNQDSEYLIDL